MFEEYKVLNIRESGDFDVIVMGVRYFLFFRKKVSYVRNRKPYVPVSWWKIDDSGEIEDVEKVHDILSEYRLEEAFSEYLKCVAYEKERAEIRKKLAARTNYSPKTRPIK